MMSIRGILTICVMLAVNILLGVLMFRFISMAAIARVLACRVWLMRFFRLAVLSGR